MEKVEAERLVREIWEAKQQADARLSSTAAAASTNAVDGRTSSSSSRPHLQDFLVSHLMVGGTLVLFNMHAFNNEIGFSQFRLLSGVVRWNRIQQWFTLCTHPHNSM